MPDITQFIKLRCELLEKLDQTNAMKHEGTNVNVQYLNEIYFTIPILRKGTKVEKYKILIYNDK